MDDVSVPTADWVELQISNFANKTRSGYSNRPEPAVEISTCIGKGKNISRNVDEARPPTIGLIKLPGVNDTSDTRPSY